MIRRALRLAGLAYDLVESAYATHRASLECDALGLQHTDAPCRRCAILAPFEARERRARERFLVLRGSR